MENIINALISAAAAIIVALIGRKTAGAKAKPQDSEIRSSNHIRWLVAMLLLAGWLIVSPIAIHHDFPIPNMFGLIVVTVIISAVWPIGAMKAAAWVFSLHALNSVCEPFARIVSGYKYASSAFSGYRLRSILITLAVVIANAALVGWISQWRLRMSFKRKADGASGVTGTRHFTDRSDSHGIAVANPDFVHQLERLAKLHKEGGISDEEYRKAKRKILDIRDRS
jgi:hypothetical protein